MTSVRKKKTTRSSKKRTIIRLTGTIEWDGDPGEILTAILREGGTPVAHEHDLAIRCTYDNRKIYEIGLFRRESNFYGGSYNATLDGEKWTGGVNCTLLRSGSTVHLQGHWDEDGIVVWEAKLIPIPATRRIRRRRKRS